MSPSVEPLQAETRSRVPHGTEPGTIDKDEKRPAVRQVCALLRASTLPFTLTVCTLKDALMLLFKGATYLETPKHDSVLKGTSHLIDTRWKAAESIAQGGG